MRIEITRAGPLATVQDAGRHGHFADGISASGPMDARGFARAGDLAATSATAGLEITMAGIAFTYTGEALKAGFSGGLFTLAINGQAKPWDAAHSLADGDKVEIKPGPLGNYGYIRFAAELDVPKVIGSRATNLIVGLGGFEGRALRKGDALALIPAKPRKPQPASPPAANEGPIRFIWGIDADQFDRKTLNAFTASSFTISTKLDRMGVRLTDGQGVFSTARILSLVSDAIVPGDIQILGDGTPIILMRDHQPTGGYPRIATLISADLDRFAQLRPGTHVQFAPVTVPHAQALLKETR